MSSTCADEELRQIGGATELRVASRRPDGTLRPYVTIWGVRSGPDVYILHRDIDAAYHAKYDSYGPKIVGSVVGPAAATVTLQALPR